MKNSSLDQLSWVGKISLWFSLVAFAGLLSVAWIAGGSGSDYLGQIQSLALARKNLPIVMISGGLLLALGTGLTTWVIVLYSSFRVAGPLYRFSQNLEQGVTKGEVPRVPIRQNDLLQAESLLLQDTASELYLHYSELDQTVAKVLIALEHKTDPQAAIDELRALEQRAQYD